MVKDVFRMVGAMMFDGVGYDHEIMLTRMQMGLAIYMTPNFLPFF